MGKNIKATAMKIDSRSVMLTITKATCHTFNSFYFGIHALCHSISNTVSSICDNVVQVGFKCLCSLFC